MKSASNQSSSIRFGRFELILQSDELRCAGAAVKLQPQPYKVLRLLVENAGQLVTRKDLQDEIWGAATFVDFDKSLNLCIAQVREVLGDNAQFPLYIETLPRRGYRFIADIESKDDEQPDTDNQTDTSDSPPQNPIKASGRSALFKISLIALLLLVAASFIYIRFIRNPPGPSVSDEKSILLVLPLENLTNDPAQDYFSDG